MTRNQSLTCLSMLVACTAAVFSACGTSPDSNDLIDADDAVFDAGFDAGFDAVIGDSSQFDAGDDANSFVDIHEDRLVNDVGDSVDALEPDWLIAGKLALSNGESVTAYDVFSAATIANPDDPFALFGECLAQVQLFFGLVDTLFGLVDGTDDPDAIAGGLAFYEPRTDQVLSMAISAIGDQSRRQLERLDKMKDYSDFTFTLDAFPLSVGGRQIANLRSTWGQAEIRVMSSVIRGLLGVIRILESQDMSTTVDDVTDAFTSDRGILPGLADLLERRPTLLTLADGGAESWQTARSDFLSSIVDLKEAVGLIDSTVSPNENVITTDAYQGHKTLVLHGIFTNGQTELPILWDGDDISLVAILNRIEAHLEGVEDSRLRIVEDIGPMLGILVDFLNKFIGISDILGSFDVELPDILTGVLESAVPDDPLSLATMLTGLFPLLGMPSGSLEFDVNAFLARPIAIRALFPHRITADPAGGHADFARSFECVRMGLVQSDWAPGQDLGWVVHDPARADDQTIDVEFASWSQGADPDGDSAPHDVETVEFTLGSVTGWFKGSLKTASNLGTATDGVLAIPDGGTIRVSYGAVLPEDVVVTSTLTAAVAADTLAYDDSCDGQATWDGQHFFETEFDDAVALLDPPESSATPVPVDIAQPDGAALSGPLFAFGSPSINGLLWANMVVLLGADTAETAGFTAHMARTDQRALNRAIAAILDKIGGLL